MTQTHCVAALNQIDRNLFARLHSEITKERVFGCLKPLADTPAPSQTVRYTRAPVLEKLLRDLGLLDRRNVEFDPDYQHTGNCVLLLGQNPGNKRVWLLAHLDVISYFVLESGEEGYRLEPFCYHMMQPGQRAGAVVAYDLDAQAYEILARGHVVTQLDGSLYFVPDQPAALRPGQRVCFDSRLTWDRNTGLLRGSLDDAGAATALILAALVLADYDVELMFGFTDEEEGVAAAGNQTIGRGCARLMRYFDQPALVIESDLQEAAPMLEGSGPEGLAPGDGACFAEKASRGRGSVTPPPLYELVRRLAEELAGEGIQLTENRGGYIGRSDGINAMLRTPNVALLGFLAENRHFDRDVTSAHLGDIVHLARAVVCLALLVQTPIWRETFGKDSHCW